MSFAGLYFTNGGWIMFCVLIFVTCCLMIATVIYSIRTYRTVRHRRLYDIEPLVFTACIFAFMSIAASLFAVLAVLEGFHNQEAYDSLTADGYEVTSIAVSSNAAVIIDDGSPSRVGLYIAPDTHRYTAYLLCPVSISYQNGDKQCIAPLE